MHKNYGADKKSALQAKFDAQKIAFGPIMFQAAKALRDLGILKYVRKAGKSGVDMGSISKDLDISLYGVKVLLEAGLGMELLILKDDRYILTKTGYFIMSDELTRVNIDFVHDVNYLGMYHLQDAIKSGKPEGLKVFGDWSTVYEGLSELPEKVKKSWFAFDHFYSDNAFDELLPIIFKDNPARILDIGGNTGRFSMKCAEYNDAIKLTILDLPGQTKVAEKTIKDFGFESRINTKSLNLLDGSKPFPKGYDKIWMSQFLDCFSQQEILSLLKRAHEAMDENASLLILETYWDKQKFEASTYSLHATSLYFTCLANGNSQMYHSEDMLGLIEEAGLYVDMSYEDIGISHTLFECRKKA